MLDLWLDSLIECGVGEALVNSHLHRDKMTAYFDRVNRRGGIRIQESYEPVLLGSAGTIAANPEFADDAERVIVIYADNFSDVPLASMLRFHEDHGGPMTMMLFRAENPEQCGVVTLDSEGRVTSFVEKAARPPSTLANAGVMILEPSMYRKIAAMKGFDLSFDILPRLVGEIRGWVWSGYHRDIGTLESYEQAAIDAESLFASRGRFSDGTRPCVFLDRDGTLLEFVDNLIDRSQVRLAPDCGTAIRRLRENGFACVVVTNQGAVGRGVLSEAVLVEEIHREVLRQLADARVMVDGMYYCTFAPSNGNRLDIEHEDRKPGPGMLKRAAAELHLRLDASWMIGDMASDVLAGANANCVGSILLFNKKKPPTPLEMEHIGRFPMVSSLTEAADWVIEHSSDLSYGVERASDAGAYFLKSERSQIA